jgi:hypothetical protein
MIRPSGFAARGARHLRIALAVVVAMALGASRPSRAADAPVDGSIHEAAEHFERAVTLYEEHDFRAALIEFERAYSVAPNYAVLYNVGQCRYQLQDYAGSLAAFEKFLATGGAEGAGDQRQRAETTLADLRKRVARVAVKSDVDGAEITVDDRVVGTTPLASPIVVSEGRRTFVASKAGHATATRSIDVAGNDSAEVTLHLEPAAPPAPNAAPAVAVIAPVATPRSSGRPIVPALVTFGLAAGGIAVGATFGIIAVGNKNDLDVQCPSRGCPPSSASEVEALKRNAVISTVGFTVGAAGLLGGVGYLLLTPARSTESGRVHPFVGPGVAGAAGTFW